MHPDLSYMLMPDSDNTEEDGQQKNIEPKYSLLFDDKVRKIFLSVLVALSVIYVVNNYLFAEPKGQNQQESFVISSGMTVGEAAYYLEQNEIIKSPWIFKNLAVLFGGKKGVIAGRYTIEKPTSLFGILKMVTTNGYGAKVFKITIPEGLSNVEISKILDENLSDFDKDKFLELAKGKEGYLFPDSYFLSPDTSPERVIEIMNDNFNERIKSVNVDITFFNKPLKDVVTMASILEKEARTEETRRMIADILWRRIKIGMALQVDASFMYLLGKGSSALSLSDLEIDSPYNTYKYQGLPPGPISNPGLDTILAALKPIKNKYWFYLSDKDGNMHYATTFEGHKLNKEKYIY